MLPRGITGGRYQDDIRRCTVLRGSRWGSYVEIIRFVAVVASPGRGAAIRGGEQKS